MAAPLPLSSEECDVLRGLIELAETPADLTTAGVAQHLGIHPDEALRTLEHLETRTPALVRPDEDAELELQVWRVTDHGREAYEESCA